MVVESPWLTVAEGATYLRMTKDELYDLINRGRVESRKRGKRGTFLRVEWLDAYMMSLPSASKVAPALRCAS